MVLGVVLNQGFAINRVCLHRSTLLERSSLCLDHNFFFVVDFGNMVPIWRIIINQISLIEKDKKI